MNPRRHSMGFALMATLAECLGAAWTSDVERAWLRAYSMIRDLMVDPRT